ncbi:putative NAD dependent epimerase/dehydratase [Corynespora cassiicola Philippines]|uniref:Putative NAD dependent epimerase/dehydratase n=1 Tax=Corynespora cassiicola Philippines TaxID=1448308 RepID=A0A2T2PEJ2_CORCC|nr:putative NAD dependent epimerase/dehydratase [Corynespora cassiicola Philippines]
MSGKTIFITGGSGYIGTVVTTLAISRGYIVRALSRSSTSDAHLESLGATPIRGSLDTHDVLTEEASKADVVISIADALAGNYTISMDDRSRINEAAITALAAGLKGSNKPLVVTSGSLAAAAHPAGDETDEQSPGWKDLLFGKLGDPHALALKDDGIRVCSVRLAPWVYGRGGSGVALFMRVAAQAGEVVYTSTVHVDDAARLYLLAAEKGRAGEAYNATSETHVSQRELAEAMAAGLGLEARSRTYAEVEGRSGAFLARFLSVENRGSSAKAREELGWVVQAERGILEEIREGSYVQIAEKLRAG